MIEMPPPQASIPYTTSIEPLTQKKEPNSISWKSWFMAAGLTSGIGSVANSLQTQESVKATLDAVDPTPFFTPAMQIGKSILLTWGPRTVAAAFGGYYGLGWAYMAGYKDIVDRKIMEIFYAHVGYAGVGAALSSVQYYSSWGIRAAAAIGVGLAYDVTARVAGVALSLLT